ncbi:MAG TPA: type II toxin-antitoxin system VapC family toxin [Tepidisphaeraceae bacterium]|jgi:PIN domain nuclease of toxin-antitoxin system
MIVLDTQIWVWWVNDEQMIPPALLGYLEVNEKYGLGVSTISVLEVARLAAAKRLVLPVLLDEWVDQALHYPNVSLIELSPQIAIESTRLPEPFHKDPADRIVVATANSLNSALATTDAKIRAYPHVKTIDY